MTHEWHSKFQSQTDFDLAVFAWNLTQNLLVTQRIFYSINWYRRKLRKIIRQEAVFVQKLNLINMTKGEWYISAGCKHPGESGQYHDVYGQTNKRFPSISSLHRTYLLLHQKSWAKKRNPKNKKRKEKKNKMQGLGSMRTLDANLWLSCIILIPNIKIFFNLSKSLLRRPTIIVTIIASPRLVWYVCNVVNNSIFSDSGINVNLNINQRLRIFSTCTTDFVQRRFCILFLCIFFLRVSNAPSCNKNRRKF